MVPPEISFPDRRLTVPAIAIALAALVLGLAAGTLHEIGGYGVESDFYGVYAKEAVRLAAGLPYDHPRSGPGYSAVLAALSFVHGDLFEVGKVLAAISYSAFGLLSFLTIRAFAPAQVALLVQVLVSIVLFRFSFTVGNDLFFAALCGASLYFLLREPAPRTVDLVLAGLFCGFAVVTRYPGVVVAAAALAYLLLLHPSRPTAGRRIKEAALFAGVALLASLPWWIANTIWHGSPFYTKTYALMALDLHGGKSNLSMDELMEMERRFGSFGELLLRDPWRIAGTLLLDFVRDVNQAMGDVVQFPAYWFVGPGLLLLFLPGASDRRRAGTFLLASALEFPIATAVPYQSRYYYPMLAAIHLPVAASLLHRYWENFVTEPVRRTLAGLRTIALAAVLLPLAAGSAFKTREYLTTEPVELLQAAEILRGVGRPGERIAAFKPHLEFLPRLTLIAIPNPADLQSFLRWFREESGARFLYVGPWETRIDPSLTPLAKGEVVPEGMTLLLHTETPPTSLFELRSR